MRVLNLGCGTKTSDCPDVVNIDWSVYLRIRRNPLLRPAVPLFLRGGRLDRFRSLPSNILVHDLSKGLPFEPNSVDVVYHSHMLEHLDRASVPGFLAEVLRVLKPGGIQRVVVPDLEVLCGRYLEHLAACQSDRREIARHDSWVPAFLEQSVRKESDATSARVRYDGSSRTCCRGTAGGGAQRTSGCTTGATSGPFWRKPVTATSPWRRTTRVRKHAEV